MVTITALRILLVGIVVFSRPRPANGQMINLSDVFDTGQSIANEVFASSSTNLDALVTAGNSILSEVQTATRDSSQSTSRLSSARSTSSSLSSASPTSTPATTSAPSAAAAAATESSSPKEEPSQSYNDRRLAIILGVVLGFLALLALITLLWFCIRHRRRQQRKKRRSAETQSPLTDSKHIDHSDHDLEKSAPLATRPPMEQTARPRTSTGSSTKSREHTDWPWTGSTTRSTAHGAVTLIPNRDHSREYDRKSDHEYTIAPTDDEHDGPHEMTGVPSTTAPANPTSTMSPMNTDSSVTPIPAPIPAPSKGQRRSISRRSSMEPVSEEPEHERLATAMDPYMGETGPERERRRSTSLPPRSLKPNYGSTTSLSGPVIVTKDHDTKQNIAGLIHPAHRPQMAPRQHSSGSGRYYAGVPIANDDRRSPEHNSPNNDTQPRNDGSGLLHPSHNTHPSDSVSPVSSSTDNDLGTPTSPAELDTLPSSPTSSAPVVSAPPPTSTSNTGVKRTSSQHARGAPEVPVPRRSSKRSQERSRLKLLNPDEARGFQFGFDSSSSDEDDERQRLNNPISAHEHGFTRNSSSTIRGYGHARHASDSDYEDANEHVAERGALIQPGPWRGTSSSQDQGFEQQSRRGGATSRGRGDYEQVHGFEDVDLSSERGFGGVAVSDAVGHDAGDERGRRRQSIMRKPVPGMGM